MRMMCAHMYVVYTCMCVLFIHILCTCVHMCVVYICLSVCTHTVYMCVICMCICVYVYACVACMCTCRCVLYMCMCVHIYMLFTCVYACTLVYMCIHVWCIYMSGYMHVCSHVYMHLCMWKCAWNAPVKSICHIFRWKDWGFPGWVLCLRPSTDEKQSWELTPLCAAAEQLEWSGAWREKERPVTWSCRNPGDRRLWLGLWKWSHIDALKDILRQHPRAPTWKLSPAPCTVLVSYWRERLRIGVLTPQGCWVCSLFCCRPSPGPDKPGQDLPGLHLMEVPLLGPREDRGDRRLWLCMLSGLTRRGWCWGGTFEV